MKFKSIDNKKILNNKLRMTEPTILFADTVNTLSEYTVHSDEICRIDLVSEKFFGTPDYSEHILKYNNISNPFSITEGDVLKIPDVEAALKNWKSIKEKEGSGEKGEQTLKDQFMDSKRLTVKDKNRIEYLKKKAAQKKNGSKQILPPNFLKDDETNIKIAGSGSGTGSGLDGGTIII